MLLWCMKLFLPSSKPVSLRFTHVNASTFVSSFSTFFVERDRGIEINVKGRIFIQNVARAQHINEKSVDWTFDSESKR